MEKGEWRTEKLPELCVAHVISLTSPRVACRLSAVSTTFRAAATSDTVWDCFLPSDWQSLVSRAVHPVEFSSFSSKRDIFFHLCDPILIDDGKMSFSVDRSSGAKCYILSARELSITWADAPWYWRWRCLPESSLIGMLDCIAQLIDYMIVDGNFPRGRFAEVAELTSVCWLEIRGKIESRMLSRKTAYAAYLIYDTANYAFGLNYPSQEASVKVGVHSSTKLVCLQPTDMLSRRHAQRASALCYRKEAEEVDGDSKEAEEVDESAEEVEEVDGAPQARNDDWMELELGEFYIDEGDDGEVKIRLLEVKGGHWKRGLIIEGIEIRPKQ